MKSIVLFLINIIIAIFNADAQQADCNELYNTISKEWHADSSGVYTGDSVWKRADKGQLAKCIGELSVDEFMIRFGKPTYRKNKTLYYCLKKKVIEEQFEMVEMEYRAFDFNKELKIISSSTGSGRLLKYDFDKLTGTINTN